MGTDTLEEVAYFLDLTVADDRPVVVVGSMRQPEAVGYEGGANLLGAFRVAADAGSRGLGVLVVLNDEINAARDVTKTHTLRVQTFQSREFGILGTVESGRVVYGRRPARPRERMPRFDISRAETLPRVDIVSAYLGATGDVIASAIASGARGLVMAGTGAGFMTPAQEAAIAKAVQGGVPVVLSSRTGSGRVLENPGNERLGVITAGDLNPYKARLLLMLAMMRTMDRGEIQRMFGES
jgi:L-asparaginase